MSYKHLLSSPPPTGKILNHMQLIHSPFPTLQTVDVIHVTEGKIRKIKLHTIYLPRKTTVNILLYRILDIFLC